jgi:hypothetical protein
MKGTVNEIGTRISLVETISDGIGNEKQLVTVTYEGEMKGGAMNGIWRSSDGRAGTFRLIHL